MSHATTRPVAIVLFSLLGALLVTSCRHLDPKTFTFGPVTCEPAAPKKPKCARCEEGSCCAEYQACAGSAPCPCWIAGREGLKSTADWEKQCGPQNDAYKALAACLDAHCASECPAEDAILRHPLVGKPAPEIAALPVLTEGLAIEGPRSIAEARGKVVVVDFWATYCGPCKQSFPHYQGIVDRHRGDVAVLAVSGDDPEVVNVNKLVDFARETHVAFPIFWDTKRETQKSYAQKGGFPETYLVDRAGVVRFIHSGYVDVDRQSIAAEIERLVAEPAPKTTSGDPAPSHARRTP